jgi:NAD(P)-dependent dehydrogenase (short-subunit alcohol dehydrogenase family)
MNGMYMTQDLFKLDGRCALITGGSRGLGKAIAAAFASAGANVLISARHEDQLRATAAELGAKSQNKVRWLAADLSEGNTTVRLAKKATDVLGRVDILVNNAGVYHSETITEIQQRNWDGLLALNLTSCMLLMRELATGMKQRGWGRIINMSSILAIASRQGAGTYSATKAALIGLTRASAIELGPFGVTVNCLAPGPFNVATPDATPTTHQKKSFARRTALGRWGRPEEVAGPALLLASAAGSYITGTTIAVDGGALARTLS